MVDKRLSENYGFPLLGFTLRNSLTTIVKDGETSYSTDSSYLVLMVKHLLSCGYLVLENICTFSEPMDFPNQGSRKLNECHVEKSAC